MQCVYHIAYEKLGITSDQDYAEYFLAMNCFGEEVPGYANIEGIEYVASTYQAYFDTLINREGISWVMSGLEAHPALKELLTEIVRTSKFPEDRFAQLQEEYLGEIDPTFQLLQNAFASHHLEGYRYPSAPLEDILPLATQAGTRAKFDLLKLTSKDYADTFYAHRQTYKVSKLTPTRIYVSTPEPEHLSRTAVYRLDGFVPSALQNGLRRLLFKRLNYPVSLHCLYLEENSYLQLHLNSELEEERIDEVVTEYFQLSRNQRVALTPLDLIRR